MTPTLFGRMQTRAFALIVIGSLWTGVITLLLPIGGSLSSRYETTFTVLGIVLVQGFAWDIFYYYLQQYRWEKDWPALFGLLTGINEGATTWLILKYGTVPGHPHVTPAAFLLNFTTVWIVTFLFVNGPIRVVFPRWRFSGGRIL